MSSPKIPVALSTAQLSSAKVNARLGWSAIVVGLLVLLLAAGFFWYEWGQYQNAKQAVSSFDTLRATFVAMEKVSAERGPSNGAMGEDLPIGQEPLSRLRMARQASDQAIGQLSDRLGAAQCRGCGAGLLAVHGLAADLTDARAGIDSLIQLPREQRGDETLRGAVDRMARIIPLFTQIIDATELDIIQGDTRSLTFLQMARMAAMLRDEAGLLGSRFTTALAAHRPLNFSEQLAIERSYGQVRQLRLSIESLAGNDPSLTNGAFTRVRDQYLAHGIAYVTSVRRMSADAAQDLPSTTDFVGAYVPMMAPILAFRDEMLSRAQVELLQHQAEAWRRCLATAIAGVVLAVLQFLLIWLFRAYVVMPFADATRAIMAIASGDLDAKTQSRAYRGPIQTLFDAIGALRRISLEHQKLEEERSQLVAELTMMAETDPLTGLLNRRAFESQVRVLQSMRSGSEATLLALVMFDIDHFRRVNDTYGHPTGDLVLQKIGEICRRTWRKNDIVARIGGEEFAVLIEVPGTGEMMRGIQRFRDALSHAALASPRGEEFTVTMSFGVAATSQNVDSTVLMAQADELLYKAKTNGRNRVESNIP